MNYFSHSRFVKLRNIARALGINSILARAFCKKKYEDAFDTELNVRIHPGDTIWDIGANIGYYSKKFSNLTGHSGTVYAFEPSPINLNVLRKNVEGIGNILVLPKALGDKEQLVTFKQGDDALGATSTITNSTEYNDTVEVEMCSGDYIIRNEIASLPNVIKIDVEGFEYEVILGLTSSLSNPTVRVVGIEVHFGLLNKRALNFAPSMIETILKSSGFKIFWPDSSHLIAYK